MKKINLKSLEDCVERSFQDSGVYFGIKTISQDTAKRDIIFNPNFKILSNKNKKDIVFNVDIDESKFMNDPFYKEHWIEIYFGPVLSLACINVYDDDSLLLSVMGFDDRFYYSDEATKIFVKGIEMYAKRDGFKRIFLNSFDSESVSFWEKLGYTQSESDVVGDMFKNL